MVGKVKPVFILSGIMLLNYRRELILTSMLPVVIYLFLIRRRRHDLQIVSIYYIYSDVEKYFYVFKEVEKSIVISFSGTFDFSPLFFYLLLVFLLTEMYAESEYKKVDIYDQNPMVNSMNIFGSDSHSQQKSKIYTALWILISINSDTI